MPPPIQGPIQGILEIQTDPDGTTRIVLDPDKADITAGGNGGLGDLVIKNPNGAEVARLGLIQEIAADPSQPTPTVVASYVGLRIRTANGVAVIRIGRIASSPTQITPADEIVSIFGGTGFSGTLRLVDKDNETRLVLGREQWNEGQIVVRDGAGRPVFHFNSEAAALYVGAAGNEGDIIVRDSEGRNVFHFDSHRAALYIGASGNEGDIIVRDSAGRNVFHFDSHRAALYIGASGNEGDIIVRDSAGRNVLHFDSQYAALYVGASGNEGDIIVRDGAGKERIRLDGNTGDIRLSGADCAEQFDVAEAEHIEPGSVLIVDDDGKLRPCERGYDKRVVGVVSGAYGLNAGIVLGYQPTGSRRSPIALTGRVYCKVDARYGAIEPGDLLTTSPSPGHAMRAEDRTQAFGAVIGKALAGLARGTGLVPIVVSLQ
jgi:hypothetical protein